MEIVSIERTPNPTAVKITMSEALDANTRYNYTKTNQDGAPAHIQSLFEIEGIESVFHVADFMSVNRDPNVEWDVLLPQIRTHFGE